MKDKKKNDIVKKCQDKEEELSQYQIRLKTFIKLEQSAIEKEEVRFIWQKIEALTDEIGTLRLHLQFYEQLGIWADELGPSFGDIFDDIIKDIKKLKNDCRYENEFIGVTVKNFMEFEMLVRDFFASNYPQEKSNIKTPISQVLRKIEQLGVFSKGQITILRKIIRLRNWLTHDLVKEERNYMKDNASSCGIVNVTGWKNYYYVKLVVLKNILCEAIDLFSNYDGSALRFL